MIYHGDITTKLQFVLIDRWMNYNYLQRTIAMLLGEPIDPPPYPDIIGRLLNL